jgi:hypothetical protein
MEILNLPVFDEADGVEVSVFGIAIMEASMLGTAKEADALAVVSSGPHATRAKGIACGDRKQHCRRF